MLKKLMKLTLGCTMAFVFFTAIAHTNVNAAQATNTKQVMQYVSKYVVSTPENLNATIQATIASSPMTIEYDDGSYRGTLSYVGISSIYMVSPLYGNYYRYGFSMIYLGNVEAY